MGTTGKRYGAFDYIPQLPAVSVPSTCADDSKPQK